MCNGTVNMYELVSDVRKLQIMNKLYVGFEIYRFSHKMRSCDVVSVYDILRETFHYLVENSSGENIYSLCIYLDVEERAKGQNKAVRGAIKAILSEFVKRDTDLRDYFEKLNEGIDAEHDNDDPEHEEELKLFHRQGEALGAIPEMFTETD